MCKHYSLSLFRTGLFQLRYINIIMRQFYINKNGHCTVLYDWRNSSRKTCCHCDDFVPLLNSSVSKLRWCKAHKSKQIGRWTGIDQTTKFNTEKICKLSFKLNRIPAWSKPKFQRAIHEIYHFFTVIYSRSIRDSVSGLKFFFLIMKFYTIFFDKT